MLVSTGRFPPDTLVRKYSAKYLKAVVAACVAPASVGTQLHGGISTPSELPMYAVKCIPSRDDPTLQEQVWKNLKGTVASSFHLDTHNDFIGWRRRSPGSTMTATGVLA